MRPLLLPALLLAGVAGAAPTKAGALARDAEKAYRDNRYDDAAALLKQAWDLEPNPKFLYNRARALDQAGRIDAALDAYRAYVALPAEETEAEIVGRANKAIERLRQLVAEREGGKKPADTPRAAEPASAGPTPRAPGAGATAQDAVKTRAPPPGSSDRGRKIGAYVAGGVSLASLGLALGFGLAANGSREAFSSATTVQAKKGAESAARTQAAVADVSLAVGVAAAVAALVLFPKGDAPAQVSVLVSPAPGGVVAAVGARF